MHFCAAEAQGEREAAAELQRKLQKMMTKYRMLCRRFYNLEI